MERSFHVDYRFRTSGLLDFLVAIKFVKCKSEPDEWQKRKGKSNKSPEKDFCDELCLVVVEYQKSDMTVNHFPSERMFEHTQF